ncbi:MAG TPA: DUF4349 domain-containing protein [Dermatophilaceae bacterium]|nr:DUF4349 domain-containing protein [Dermatophilaceae bacterium]
MSIRPIHSALRRLAVITVAAMVVLLAGCSGASTGSGTSSSGANAGGGAAVTAGGDLAGAPETAPKPAAQPGRASAATPGTTAVAPKIVKTATISVEVKDIAAAASSVRGIATGQRGYVVSESIGSGDGPKPLADRAEPLGGFGQLTISVPAAALDATLAELAKVGTVLSRTSSAQDVTSEFVDTDSRLRTMRASVERVRALMAKATTIGQVVSLESELAQREADLESLTSQLAVLTGNVERSTVTVSLTTPARLAEQDQGGFLAGLRAGWDAFAASARGLLTALGAVLPFAGFLAVVGIPLLAWVRRRRSAATPASSAAPASSAVAAPTPPVLQPAGATPSPAPDAPEAP